MDNIEKAVRLLVQGCSPVECEEAAELLGVEHPCCADVDGYECEDCSERVADAIAARLMPHPLKWPRFEDGEPVRIGDMAQGIDCDEYVGSVRIDKAGWTLFDECREYIDSGGFADRAERPAPVAEHVRCAECRHARVTPRGMVCALHGDAGWFATEADGYCWRGERR